MCLESNTIDLDSVRFHELDDFGCCSGLSPVILEVVVVVIQLGSGVDFGGKLKGKWNESLANGVIEDSRTVCAIFVKSWEMSVIFSSVCHKCIESQGFTFINNVPASTSTLVSASNGLDMVIHDGYQGCVVETALRDPGGKLTMPDECMAMNLFLLYRGIVSDRICTIKSKDSARWFGRLPLHGIFRCNGPKVGVVINNGSLLYIERVSDGQGSTNEGPPFGDNGGMKSHRPLLEIPNAEDVSNFNNLKGMSNLRWVC